MHAEVAPKYSSIEVDLSGVAGNPVSVMSHMRMALRAARVPASEVSAFFDEAMSQEYGQLLETCARWVRVHVAPPDEEDDAAPHDLAA